MIWRWWLAAALGAQAFGDAPSLDRLLPQLVANGQRYEAALPSLTCDETVTSQLLKSGKVKEQVTLEAAMRVRRTGDPARPFTETHEWKTRNGAAVPAGKGVNAPYFVVGTFTNGLSFSSMERLACYDLSLQAAAPVLELQMRRKPGVDAVPACQQIAPGTSRRVLIDSATGHVSHLERTIPPAESERRKEVYFAAIDYAPVQLGAETFWLPLRAEMHDSSDERRMQAHYSGCKRFTGTISIVNSVTPAPQ